MHMRSIWSHTPLLGTYDIINASWRPTIIAQNLPRPRVSLANQNLALDFACMVTCEDQASLVARHGQNSIYSVLERTCPGIIRNSSTTSCRKGISEAEFLRVLAVSAEPVHNRTFARYRVRKAVKRSDDPTGAGMCMFRDIRWRVLADPIDAQHLREQHQRLVAIYPPVYAKISFESMASTLSSVISTSDKGSTKSSTSLTDIERLKTEALYAESKSYDPRSDSALSSHNHEHQSPRRQLSATTFDKIDSLGKRRRHYSEQCVSIRLKVKTACRAPRRLIPSSPVRKHSSAMIRRPSFSSESDSSTDTSDSMSESLQCPFTADHDESLEPGTQTTCIAMSIFTDVCLLEPPPFKPVFDSPLNQDIEWIVSVSDLDL